MGRGGGPDPHQYLIRGERLGANFCPRCGQPLSEEGVCPGCHWPLEAPSTGPGSDVIGRNIDNHYHVLRRLGAGGMAEVYVVEHIRMGKRMAMKVLRPEDLPAGYEDFARKQFEAEAAAASRLTSVHTVAVFDFGSTREGLLYLVMELIRGRTLRQLVEAKRFFQEVEAAEIGEQVLISLEEAHTRGLIHRDIKPDNIMLVDGPPGTILAKVLDFGIAHALWGHGSAVAREEQASGQFTGTPEYVSSEQAQGLEMGPSSDLFSLGSTLFELITGHPPYHEATPVETLAAIIAAKEAPTVVRRGGAAVDPEFAEILERAMTPAIEGRYVNAAAMRADLARFRKHRTEAGHAAATTAPAPAAAPDPAVERASPLPDEKLPGASVSHQELEAAASRADFEAFETELKRSGLLRWLVPLALLVLAGIGVGLYLAFGGGEPPAPPRGKESEPNNESAEADPLDLPGQSTGMLGKRLSKEQADQDWYGFEVVERQVVRLAVTPIPNMNLEAAVFPGAPDENNRLTALILADDRGRGEGEIVPNLLLDPGAYLVRITEARPAEGPYYPTENISDEYRISLEGRPPAPDEEVEPNEGRAAATPLGFGETVRGLAATAGDRDWFRVELPASKPKALELTISDLTGAARQVAMYGMKVERPLYRYELVGKNRFARKLKVGRKVPGTVFFEVLGPEGGGAAERWYSLTVK